MKSLVCAALWLFACGFSQAQALITNELRNGLTLDDFLADPALSQPELSPNGRWLSFLQMSKGKALLAIVDLDQEELSVRHVAVGDELFVNWVEWANDDWLIVSATVFGNMRGEVFTRDNLEDADFDRVRSAPIPMTRLIMVHREGDGHHVAFKGDKSIERRNLNLGRVVSFLPKDPDHFLIAARLRGDLDLFKIQVSTGEHERVAIGKDYTIGWYVDANGDPAFRVDQNRTGTRLYYYGAEAIENGEIKWRRLKSVRVSDVDHAVKQTTEFRPIAPGPDVGTYYVAARPEGANTTGIYLYNFETAAFEKEIKSHPALDIENAIINWETYEYYGSYYFEDTLKIEYLDSKLQAHINGLNTFFEGKVSLVPLDSSRDGKKWLLWADGPRIASRYYVYSTEEANIESIGGAWPTLLPEKLSDVEIIKYQARDGTQITGYYTRPNGLVEGQIPPLVMYPHGGPEMRDIYEFNRDAQIFAANGYAVFQPNFRGSSGYGIEFADAGRRQWGGTMQTDVEDGLLFLQASGKATPGRACIVGYSYGSYAALAAATLTPDAYQCVIAGGGPSDLLEQLKYVRVEDGSDSDNYEYWVEHMGHPSRDKDALRAASPSQRAQYVKAPVLLIHGADDHVVPVKQSEIMLAALREAGKSVDFVKLEESGHSFRTDEDERKELVSMLNFLSTNLPVYMPGETETLVVSH